MHPSGCWRQNMFILGDQLNYWTASERTSRANGRWLPFRTPCPPKLRNGQTTRYLYISFLGSWHPRWWRSWRTLPTSEEGHRQKPSRFTRQMSPTFEHLKKKTVWWSTKTPLMKERKYLFKNQERKDFKQETYKELTTASRSSRYSFFHFTPPKKVLFPKLRVESHREFRRKDVWGGVVGLRTPKKGWNLYEFVQTTEAAGPTRRVLVEGKLWCALNFAWISRHKVVLCPEVWQEIRPIWKNRGVYKDLWVVS